jgi:hypothetical protein
VTGHTALFAAAGLIFYAAHHVGDYWVQTDHQARHKDDAGFAGQQSCIYHVATYVMTQAVFLCAASLVLGMRFSFPGYCAALAVSGVSHYLADRREHGIMFKLARLLPGKADFLKLGVPRGLVIEAGESGPHTPLIGVDLDNPGLGTGAWALDQAWHIFWGVFVAALLLAGLS